MDNIPPYLHRSGMIQFPVFFEDGAYLWQNGELSFKSAERVFKQKGLKIINIHPMHLMLNTPYFSYTRNIKDTVSKEAWNAFDDAAIKQMRNKDTGILNFIDEMIEFIHKNNIQAVYLNDIYERLC